MTLQSSVPVTSPRAAHPSHAKSSAAGNGPIGAAALPKPGRVPSARRSGNRGLFLLYGLVVLAVVAIAGGGVWYFFLRGPVSRTDLVTAKVEYKDLQLKIVERGTPGGQGKPRRQVRGQDRQPGCRQDSVGGGQRLAGEKGRSACRDRRLLPSRTGHDPEDQPRQSRVRQDHRGTKLPHRPRTRSGWPSKTPEKWVKGDFPQQLHDLEGQIQTSQSTCSRKRSHGLGGADGQEELHDRQPGASGRGPAHGRQARSCKRKELKRS